MQKKPVKVEKSSCFIDVDCFFWTVFWPWLSAYFCLRGLRPAKKQTSTNHGNPLVFVGRKASARFWPTPQRVRNLQHRRAENRYKNASKTEAREATQKSPTIIVLGRKMPPKIDPGGLFLASGAALARQEAARRTKSQDRRCADQPKSGPRARRRYFSPIWRSRLGGINPYLGFTTPDGGGSGPEISWFQLVILYKKEQVRLRK